MINIIMSEIEFEIIATYGSVEQDIFSFTVSTNMLTEERLMNDILIQLENLDDLEKISVCCIEEISAYNFRLLSWLFNRYGKYYFNTNVNTDDDTKYWSEYKTKFSENLAMKKDITQVEEVSGS